MTALADLTLAEAARRLAARDVSPVELTRAALDRIAALDSSYNAFITVTADIAMSEAGRAESEIAAGRYRGPMHGVPYALKDLFDVAGLPTTCHSKLRAGHRAASDAFAVARLREAGAVLLGKTALHEFATGGPTLDLPWPPARNPWDPAVHPGGSSSGAATAVTLGMAFGALGSDAGGSVRNPATCCGIVGLKPTYGLVSRTGAFPLSFSLDHVGPLTRTVEDNAILLQAIAGHDPADATSSRRDVPDLRVGIGRDIRGLRIGVVEHFFREDAEADAEQVAAFEQALATLRDLGADLRPARLPPLNAWVDCGRTLLQAEAYAIHEKDLQKRPQDYAPITLGKILPGAFIAAHDYVKAQQWRTALARGFAEAMRGLDAMVTLSSFTVPCRVDDAEAVALTYERHCRMPFNVTGTPAIAVPTGFSAGGLPLGMQIATRAFDETMLYRIAHAFCAATRLTECRPPALARLPKPRLEGCHGLSRTAGAEH
jgi:aspartyl-tRNA(Asn)/glutamyl-tRNA(Gln) amidotransferase subunit A